MVRMKLRCKDQQKIPLFRVVEMQDKLFLISFKAEGVEQDQGEIPDGGDKEKGEDEENFDTDDLLGSDLELEKDPELEDPQNGEDPETGDNSGGKSSEGTWKQSQNSQGKSVRRSLCRSHEDKCAGFFGFQNEFPDCINLLHAMGLGDMDDELEEEVISIADGEDEPMNLPSDWVHSISESVMRDNSEHQGGLNLKSQDITVPESEGASLQMKKTVKWGPIQVERKSKRNPNDNRTMLQRAQDLKEVNDLPGKKGKKASKIRPLDTSDFCSIAGHIGLDLSGSKVLENMILGKDRDSSFSNSCTHSLCKNIDNCLDKQDSVLEEVEGQEAPSRISSSSRLGKQQLDKVPNTCLGGQVPNVESMKVQGGFSGTSETLAVDGNPSELLNRGRKKLNRNKCK